MRDHRSLIAWQRAHFVVRAVLAASKDHWKPYAAAVLAQLQRSSLSVQLNIAEGYAIGTSRRRCYHLVVAYGSAVETTELLDLSLEESLLPSALAGPALVQSRETQALLLGLIKKYRSRDSRPPRQDPNP